MLRKQLGRKYDGRTEKARRTGGKYLKMSEIPSRVAISPRFSRIEEKSRDWCILPPVSVVVLFGPIIGIFGNLTH